MSEQQQSLSVANDTTDTTDTSDTSDTKESTSRDDTVKMRAIRQEKKELHSTQASMSNGHNVQTIAVASTPEHEIVVVEEDPQKTLKMPALRRTTRILPLEHDVLIGQAPLQSTSAIVPSPVRDQHIPSFPSTTSHSDENFFSFSETDVDILDIILDKTYSFIHYEAVSVIPQTISMDNEHLTSDAQDFSEIDIDSIDSLMLPEHTQQHEIQQQAPTLDNEAQLPVSATSLEPISETDIELPFILTDDVVGATFMAPTPMIANLDETTPHDGGRDQSGPYAGPHDIQTQDESLDSDPVVEAPLMAPVVAEDSPATLTTATTGAINGASTTGPLEDEEHVDEIEPPIITEQTEDEQAPTAETPLLLQAETEVVGAPLMAPVVPIVQEEQETPEAQEQPADSIELPETPRVIDTSIPLTPLPEPSSEPIITPALTTRQPVRTRQQRKRQPLWRRILFGGLLFLLMANAFLLWRDLTSTHLDLTTIDPRNGSTRTQQDIGSYQDAPSLTAPILDSSSAFVGVQSKNGRSTQQVLVFTGNATWNLATQFSAPLTHGTLQISPDGHLFVQSMNALQVWSVDKQAHEQFLWQIQGPQPTRGVHPFQPASDGQNLYTIKSVASAQIASYALQTGQQRWSQTLHDTLNYAPPFLVDGQTLYVASDSNIYALKSNDGTLLWEKPYPTRTLLLAQVGPTPSIIAVGAKGVLALNITTGATVWSFTGQATNTLTSTQFYQAALAHTDHATAALIYATGIAWQIPQVRKQLWFYAINAHTGSLVWSRPVSTDFVSTDAGRILTPIVDTTDGIVLLQQQVDEQSQRILAFDAVNGAERWSKNVQNSNGSSPTLLRTPDDSLLLFSIVDESSSIFRTFSPWRLLMIQLITASIVSLLLLWLLPLDTLRTRFAAQLLTLARRRGPIHGVRRGPVGSSVTLTTATKGAMNGAPTTDALKLVPTTGSGTSRLTVYNDTIMAWHIPYRWLALVLIGIVLGAGIVTYVRLNQPQNRILQVSAGTGATRWQQGVPQGTQPLATNTQNSFIVTQTANNTSQLQSLNAQGQMNWQSFSSEGTFSIPVSSPRSGTLLVALSGHSPLHYQFAPSDPSYDHTLDSFLALYLFDQASGRTLWQSNAIYPDEHQDSIVLGADTRDIYIASTQAIPSTGTQGSPPPTVQLFALNQDTGTVDWRVFGPAELAKGPRDVGKLLLHQGLAIWQVAGIVYAIDTSVGQIAWRQPLLGDSATLLVPEEQQMIFAPNTVLVTRLDGIHALDLNSGNELWHIPVVGTSVGTSFSASAPAPGIALVGHTLLLYGNNEVDAYDVNNQQNLWHHKQHATIQRISIADNGKLAYILLLTNASSTTPEPSVAALDIQTGTVDWTFTSAIQSRVLNTYSDGFFYSHGVLFVTICSSSSQETCVSTHLYALDGITGKTIWSIAGTTLSDLHISQDGSTLLFRLTK